MTSRRRASSWLLNVAVLTASAWLIAQSMVELAKAKYLDTPEPPYDVETGPSVESPPGRGRGPVDVAQRLSVRRPFNVDTNVERPGLTAGCQPQCIGKVCGDDGCGGTCGHCPGAEVCDGAGGRCATGPRGIARSELNVTLQGTMVSPSDPTARWATVAAGGESCLLEVGSELFGDRARVVDIQPRVLFLQEGEKLTYVALWSGASMSMKTDGDHATEPSVEPSPKRPNATGVGEVAAPLAAPVVDFSSFVKFDGENQYTINRQMLDEQLRDLASLTKGMRIIPSYSHTRGGIFKVIGIPPNSLFRAIGIRSGDRIVSVNGDVINSPNKALELFAAFKNASSVRLEIERRGQLETFQYVIQ